MVWLLILDQQLVYCKYQKKEENELKTKHRNIKRKKKISLKQNIEIHV